jgi:hypothetical protein
MQITVEELKVLIMGNSDHACKDEEIDKAFGNILTQLKTITKAVDANAVVLGRLKEQVNNEKGPAQKFKDRLVALENQSEAIKKLLEDFTQLENMKNSIFDFGGKIKELNDSFHATRASIHREIEQLNNKVIRDVMNNKNKLLEAIIKDMNDAIEKRVYHLVVTALEQHHKPVAYGGIAYKKTGKLIPVLVAKIGDDEMFCIASVVDGSYIRESEEYYNNTRAANKAFKNSTWTQLKG